MGLDMYLTGEAYFPNGDRKRGAVKAHLYDLGHWRKHPNLHGYIVRHFADGEDDCREIALGAGDLEQILGAVRRRQLPPTDGLFFGASDGRERELDIRVLSEALAWLRAEPPGEWRSVSYRASW